MTARLRIGVCLSLTGRFSRFGQQAAAGLDAWQSLTGAAEVTVEDDGSDLRQLQQILPGAAARCDLMLGPYSTVLMRAAGTMAAERGWLLWNHGGSGDDVQAAQPGHVVSLLTPASRYAEPFLRHAAGQPRDLVVVSGTGRFGQQLADGAMNIARELGIGAIRLTPDHALTRRDEWDLLSAGVFEDDVTLVGKALRLARAPRRICAVAAGVHEFRQAAGDPEGIFGIAQWFPGSSSTAATGPAEKDFLTTYAKKNGTQPDYPAVQVAAGAAVAVLCAQLAGSTRRPDLWPAATSLETSTLFGPFGINAHTGAQIRHQTVLTRWTGGKLTLPMAATRQ